MPSLLLNVIEISLLLSLADSLTLWSDKPDGEDGSFGLIRKVAVDLEGDADSVQTSGCNRRLLNGSCCETRYE